MILIANDLKNPHRYRRHARFSADIALCQRFDQVFEHTEKHLRFYDVSNELIYNKYNIIITIFKMFRAF